MTYARRRLMPGLFWACVACQPETDLASERPPAAVDARGTGPAAAFAPRIELVAPAPGSSDVPSNLAVVVVRTVRPLMDQETAGALVLRPRSGPAIPLGPWEHQPCADGGDCYEALVQDPLAAGTFVVELARPLFTVDGATLFPAPLGSLAIQDRADREAPRLGEPEVSPAADCLRVRVQADEPVRAMLLFRGAGVEELISAGTGGLVFDVAVRFVRLAPGTELRLILWAVDQAGNQSLEVKAAAHAPGRGPPLAITEVLANPAGPETTQEFVELRNLGQVPLSLEGLFLEDAGGSDRLPALQLAPGAYALVVPAGFDPAGPKDTPPRPGTPLAQVEGRLGKDGLSNAGEVVRIRTADGTVVSSYGGWVDVSARAWDGRSVHRAPDEEACDHPRSWTQKPQPPTPGW
jgi:hypothetical protein